VLAATRKVISVLGRIAALATAVAAGGCGTALLSPAGPIAHAERTILLDSVTLMLVIVVPTIAATVIFAWWFRSSNARARYLPTWEYAGQLELLVWSIPALVILFLGGIAWLGSHELDPARKLISSKRAIEIQVVSLDWKWLFVYPEQGIASINRIVAPAGVPLHFSVTSATVMNVFFVPRLGSEIYSMYGMSTQLNLQADRPGDYPGLSAHFSGDGFSDMAFDLLAVTPQQFASWVAATRESGPTLDDDAYRELRHQTQNLAPYTYRDVRKALFDDIVNQKLPPGEGPQAARVLQADSAHRAQ
jgi:cytochrome o ubiquinol oxidase subunit II